MAAVLELELPWQQASEAEEEEVEEEAAVGAGVGGGRSLSCRSRSKLQQTSGKALPLSHCSPAGVCLRARVSASARRPSDRLTLASCARVQTGRDSRPPGTGWTILRRAGGQAERGEGRAERPGERRGKRVSE